MRKILFLLGILACVNASAQTAYPYTTIAPGTTDNLPANDICGSYDVNGTVSTSLVCRKMTTSDLPGVAPIEGSGNVTVLNTNNQVVFRNTGAAVTYTLPIIGTGAGQATPSGFAIIIQNDGTGEITLTPGAGNTVGGQSTQLIPIGSGVNLTANSSTNWELNWFGSPGTSATFEIGSTNSNTINFKNTGVTNFAGAGIQVATGYVAALRLIPEGATLGGAAGINAPNTGVCAPGAGPGGTNPSCMGFYSNSGTGASVLGGWIDGSYNLDWFNGSIIVSGANFLQAPLLIPSSTSVASLAAFNNPASTTIGVVTNNAQAAIWDGSQDYTNYGNAMEIGTPAAGVTNPTFHWNDNVGTNGANGSVWALGTTTSSLQQCDRTVDSTGSLVTNIWCATRTTSSYAVPNSQFGYGSTAVQIGGSTGSVTLGPSAFGTAGIVTNTSAGLLGTVTALNTTQLTTLSASTNNTGTTGLGMTWPAATFTDNTAASGTVGTVEAVYSIAQPTIAGTQAGGTTFTSAATLYVVPPTNGTHVTGITTAYSFYGTGALGITGGGFINGAFKINDNNAGNFNLMSSSGATGTITIGNSSNTGKTNFPGLGSLTTAQTGSVCFSSTGGLLSYDPTNTCLVSDGRFKTGVAPLDAGIETVLLLRPVSYTLVPELDPDHVGRQVGLIAQDVAKVDERLISRYADGPDKGTPRGVRYQQLTAVLVKSVQQLNTKIDRQQLEIYALLVWCLGLTFRIQIASLYRRARSA